MGIFECFLGCAEFCFCASQSGYECVLYVLVPPSPPLSPENGALTHMYYNNIMVCIIPVIQVCQDKSVRFCVRSKQCRETVSRYTRQWAELQSCRLASQDKSNWIEHIASSWRELTCCQEPSVGNCSTRTTATSR